jgi:hypothetical protein
MGVPSESVVFIAQFLSSKNKQNKDEKFSVYKSLILGKWGELNVMHIKKTNVIFGVYSVYTDSRVSFP